MQPLLGGARPTGSGEGHGQGTSSGGERPTLPSGAISGGLAAPTPEEVAARRHARRAEMIARVKTKELYLTSDPKCRRPTPDPSDRTISKHRWEELVRYWRFSMW